MVKKKVDSRIRTLIENGVKLRHRTMFVIVGDRGRDQVVNLHYMLSKASVRTRPSVLWCYKKDLGFTSHREKRAKKIKRDIARGLRNADEENPFELFIGATDIRYTYYKESHKVLGNTYGMCVLQDFQALTPNLLARTIETVEGGGIVVLLLKTMESLKQLYTMTMDVHSRYRTEAHQDVVARFNERFLLSLGLCSSCLVVDDELNILPISSGVRQIKKVTVNQDGDEKGDVIVSESDVELRDLKAAMKDTPPVGALVEACRTLDQAKAVLTFVEAVNEKTLRSTVVLTAARGRGKSAALGLAMAGAVAYGYSNIFVTAPSPENLKTLFDMVLKGFDALEYKEHMDYEVVQSTNPQFNKAVVRVNIFHTHRQTIQYIQPQDAHRLSQAELLVIDEAAAIPLPLVEKLLGPYLVFMSSTVNGYEGTGRSLSLKLVKQLRTQASAASTSSGGSGGSAGASGSVEGKSTSLSASGARVLRELTLDEPIRYAQGDPIESWLNALLCLDCTNAIPRLITGVPHPNKCDLYYVNRDTLFSFHKASEAFLQRMMALYVSSHYKNSPNDLQLMSDAPAHHLFVLLGPIDPNVALPDILCVIQVCLEGEISRESMQKSLARGLKASGDLIPWCISQQFQNNEFASLSGARIVRIATHPELHRMGYATRALELLTAYYEGKISNLSEATDLLSSAAQVDVLPPVPMKGEKKEKKEDRKRKNGDEESKEDDGLEVDTSKLLAETVSTRANLPPLLSALSERAPEPLHYIGTSFGLTQSLYNFWKRNQFNPVYLRSTASNLTGEFTCIMIKALLPVALKTVAEDNWLATFTSDFQRRFASLLSITFNKFTPGLGLSLLAAQSAQAEEKSADDEDASSLSPSGRALTYAQLSYLMTEFDLRRLESYARNLVDYHLVLDLIPMVARAFFLKQMPTVSLSYAQQAILLALGLQHKTVTDIEEELGLNASQVLALFNKSIRKISSFLRSLEEKAVEQEITASANSKKAAPNMKPLNENLDAELGKSGKQSMNDLQKQQMALLENLDLQQFEIGGTEEEWDAALRAGKTSVSIKSTNPAKHQKGDRADKKDSKDKAKEHKKGGASKKGGAPSKKGGNKKNRA